MSDKIPFFSQNLLKRLKAFSKDSSSRTRTPANNINSSQGILWLSKQPGYTFNRINNNNLIVNVKLSFYQHYFLPGRNNSKSGNILARTGRNPIRSRIFTTPAVSTFSL